MFAKLKGIVDSIDANTVVIDVQGVGYELYCSGACVSKLEVAKPASVVVFTDVNENSIRLYGFADALEKQVFMLLTTVKGVGSKTSMEIISQLDGVELLRAIGAGDAHRLQALRGVGKKTAERIIVELKDRVAEYALERSDTRLHIERTVTDPMREACEALEALGITRKDAERAVATVQSKGLTPSATSAWVVKEALRYI